MKRKWLGHVAALAAFAVTAPVWAQDGNELFGKLDSNKDGFVTEDEVEGERKVMFERMLNRGDKDGDKKLSKEEFVAIMRDRPREGQRDGDRPRPEGRPERPEEGRDRGDPQRPPFGPPALIRALDSDANGEISAEEIKGAAESLLKLDKNGDGKLTREELMPGVAGGPDGLPPGVAEFARRMKQADTNGDGKLSKEEAPERMRENFDRVDTNSDGFVDEAEMRQMFERMRAGFGDARPGGDRRGDQPRDREPRERDRPRDGERREGDRPRDGEKSDRPREGDRDRPRDGDRPRARAE